MKENQFNIQGKKSIGLRLKLYWEDDQEWFAGVIEDYNEAQGYFVHYDDDEKHWEDLSTTKFKLLTNTISTDQQDLNKFSMEEKVIEKYKSEAIEKYTETENVIDDNYSKRINKVNDQLEEVKILENEENNKLKLKKKDSNHVCYRDKESLLDLIHELQTKKQKLLDEQKPYKLRIQKAEAEAISIKQQLVEYQTKATLSDVETSAGLNISKSSSTTSIQDQILGLKIQNRNYRHKINQLEKELEATKEKNHSSSIKLKKSQEKLDCLPAKEKQSLVEIQMEISLLLEEKRRLEREKAKKIAVENDHDTETEKHISRLRQELNKISDDLIEMRQEKQHYTQLLEIEKAKLIPLEQQYDKLKQKLGIK